MKSETIGVFIWLGIVLFGIAGWVMNIMAIAQLEAINGFGIVRVIGVFIAPLGAILGYL